MPSKSFSEIPSSPACLRKFVKAFQKPIFLRFNFSYSVIDNNIATGRPRLVNFTAGPLSTEWTIDGNLFLASDMVYLLSIMNPLH